MCAYHSFDPRSDIRSQIGYTRYVQGEDRSTVSVLDDYNDYVYIPLLLPGEVRTGSLPEMPFIEMTLVSQPVSVHNVGGNVRDQEAYIDFNIYYTNTDKVTASTFGKTVANEVVDKVMDNRVAVSGCTWMEVINDGREIIEDYVEGKSVVFHRVVEVYCKNYDFG